MPIENRIYIYDCLCTLSKYVLYETQVDPGQCPSFPSMLKMRTKSIVNYVFIYILLYFFISFATAN